MTRPWLILLAALLAGCSSQGLRDFESDGCTLFPDRSFVGKNDWSECCFEHDIAYWKGGTREERLKADQALRDCVLEKTGNPHLAGLMYRGVRCGGSPCYPTWYRWGYGWPYGRMYRALTEEEKAEVEAKLREYRRSPPCDRSR